LSAPVHPGLEKDLARIVALLQESTVTTTDVAAADAVVDKVLPVLNSLNVHNGIVAVALFSILLSMADEMEKEEAAADKSAQAVN
jgi:hypothetical protein